MSNYNENYDILYYSDEDVFDIEDFNKNFSVVADELDSVTDLAAGKADKDHGHNLSFKNITGLCPINKGGTGANTSDEARKNLEISKYCYVVASDDSDETLKTCADFIVHNVGDIDSSEGGLQYVINSVPAGSIVRLLAGTYYLKSSAIVINKPLKLIGSGHATVIWANSNNNAPIFKLGTDDIEKPTSNITIEDMYLYYNDSGYNNERNLIEASNINGLYIYRVGLNYNIKDEIVAGSAIIKGSGYLRNVHIHDCVINSNIQSNDYERYCFNFKEINQNQKGEFCAYISNTSYLTNTVLSVNMLDEDMKNKIALTGILGGYKLYVNKQEVIV